jgi:hypothetical protein
LGARQALLPLTLTLRTDPGRCRLEAQFQLRLRLIHIVILFWNFSQVGGTNTVLPLIFVGNLCAYSSTYPSTGCGAKRRTNPKAESQKPKEERRPKIEGQFEVAAARIEGLRWRSEQGRKKKWPPRS